MARIYSNHAGRSLGNESYKDCACGCGLRWQRAANNRRRLWHPECKTRMGSRDWRREQTKLLKQERKRTEAEQRAIVHARQAAEREATRDARHKLAVERAEARRERESNTGSHCKRCLDMPWRRGPGARCAVCHGPYQAEVIERSELAHSNIAANGNIASNIRMGRG
jgi:hypothetical protein